MVLLPFLLVGTVLGLLEKTQQTIQMALLDKTQHSLQMEETWEGGENGGHSIVSHIMFEHLTANAKEKIALLMGEKEITSADFRKWGYWTDSIKRNQEAKGEDTTYTWTGDCHGANSEKGAFSLSANPTCGKTMYSNARITDKAKAKLEELGYKKLKACTIDVLPQFFYDLWRPKPKTLTEEVWKDRQQVALKMIIHLMGDIHQPLHNARKEDFGGDWFAVRMFPKTAASEKTTVQLLREAIATSQDKFESIILHYLWDWTLIKYNLDAKKLTRASTDTLADNIYYANLLMPAKSGRSMATVVASEVSTCGHGVDTIFGTTTTSPSKLKNCLDKYMTDAFNLGETVAYKHATYTNSIISGLSGKDVLKPDDWSSIENWLLDCMNDPKAKNKCGTDFASDSCKMCVFVEDKIVGGVKPRLGPEQGSIAGQAFNLPPVSNDLFTDTAITTSFNLWKEDFDQNIAVVDKQLLLAGQRGAYWLNQLWP